MASYVETKIKRALASHLAGLTLSPTMQVAYPGVQFTPPAAGYLRATFIPNTVNQITLGDAGENRFLGLFQVDVFWPQDEGYSKPTERAGAVAAHFKRGIVITLDGVTVRIIRPPSVAQALQSPPYVMVPVTIPYQVDAANPS